MASGSVPSLFPRYFGDQFINSLRIVEAHEAAEKTPPLPPNGVLGGIREPECTTDAEPHVPLPLRIHGSSQVAPDVRVGQMSNQLHKELIPRIRARDTLSNAQLLAALALSMLKPSPAAKLRAVRSVWRVRRKRSVPLSSHEPAERDESDERDD